MEDTSGSRMRKGSFTITDFPDEVFSEVFDEESGAAPKTGDGSDPEEQMELEEERKIRNYKNKDTQKHTRCIRDSSAVFDGRRSNKSTGFRERKSFSDVNRDTK